MLQEMMEFPFIHASSKVYNLTPELLTFGGTSVRLHHFKRFLKSLHSVNLTVDTSKPGVILQKNKQI